MHNLIYARVSTQEYQDYSRQLADLENEILREGHNKDSIKVFAEKISGYKKNDERPALSGMFDFIKENPDSKIWVSEISRLGRNPNETRKTIDQLSEMNIPVHIQSLGRATLDSNGKRDSIVNIILQVLMEFAHSESEQMKIRIKSGKLASAKKGKHSTNVFPYGYTKDDNGIMVIEPTEAKVIEMIFDYYSKGKGTRAIATILNSMKVPTKFNLIYESGKQIGDLKKAEDFDWGISTVMGIIKNSAYKGQRQYKDELIDCPPIVTPELFDLCTDIRENKTNRNYLTSYTYLLKDLLKCGCCGRNYYARHKPTAKGDSVYMCSSKITSKPCGQVSVNIPFIESVIYDQVITDPSIWKYLSNTEKLKQELSEEIETLEQQKKILSNEIGDLNKKFNKLLDLMLDDNSDTMIERFKIKKKEFEDKIFSVEQKLSIIKKDLRNKLDAQKSFDSDKLTLEILTKSIDNRSELQTIFRQFINKIVVNQIGKKYIMLTMHMKFGDIVLKPKMKTFLDRTTLRKNPKYKTAWSVIAKFKDDILLTSPEDIQYELETDYTHLEWKELDKSKFLKVS